MWEKLDKWLSMEKEFLDDIRNEKELGEHHRHTRRNDHVTMRNRNRMNYSVAGWNALRTPPLKDIGGKKLVLFGAGRYADAFLDLYGMDYDVAFIVDNSKEKQGLALRSIEIVPPDCLQGISEEKYQVMVCMKDHMQAFRQLDSYGLGDYRLYDGRVYERQVRKPAVPPKTAKPYHIGYISGVFDLFHKGHLNLLRRAKGKCDYLIVGVVSDEGVRKFKHVEPFVPFEERREMVEACRYVDEAVEIPLCHRGVREAYQLYRFDCQFCGSDYLNDPVFMADREWLKTQGSNMEV